MTLDDNTEIVHSENYFVDGKEQVKVEIEKPIEGGFASAECILPIYEWKNVSGFSREDIDRFQELLESVSHIIIDLARNGGVEVSIGYCAQNSGMTEPEFISFLGQNNVSIFCFDSEEELLKDIENA